MIPYPEEPAIDNPVLIPGLYKSYWKKGTQFSS